MSRLKAGAAVVGAMLALSGGVLAGCGGSDPSEADTPSNAPTAVNSAVQTDSKGNTVSTEAPSATDTGTDTAAAGDAAAGKTVFANNCDGCHAKGGQEASVGPKLAGAGLSLDRIQTQVKNGGGGMPPFDSLPEADFNNVVAYVASLQ